MVFSFSLRCRWITKLYINEILDFRLRRGSILIQYGSSSLLGFLFLILELKFGIEKYIDGVKNSISRS